LSLFVRKAFVDAAEASTGAANNEDRCGRYVAIPTEVTRWIDAMKRKDKIQRLSQQFQVS
jgi:hypothetical protein